MNNRFYIFALLILFSGCYEGLLMDMQRTQRNPVVSPACAESFRETDMIAVSWEEDSGADEYLLYRSADTAVPSYKLVYRGTSLTFEDRDVKPDHRYLYTLAKTRGTKFFGPSDPVLGVVSGVVLDTNEPNGTKESAVKLVWDLQSNLYYYKSFSGEELLDTDWYMVSIPPRRKAVIVITQEDLTGTDSWMSFSLEEHVPRTVISGNGISIENNTYEEKDFYFFIFPLSTKFINDPASGGGNFINYTLSLDQITGL